MSTENTHNKNATEGCAAAAGYVAWSTSPVLDINGNRLGRKIRCERCGWESQYKAGYRKAAMRRHICPHTDEMRDAMGEKKHE